MRGALAARVGKAEEAGITPLAVEKTQKWRSASRRGRGARNESGSVIIRGRCPQRPNSQG